MSQWAVKVKETYSCPLGDLVNAFSIPAFFGRVDRIFVFCRHLVFFGQLKSLGLEGALEKTMH